jgi:AraC-like DNA-binding protein
MYAVKRLRSPSDICAVVESTSPWAVCFEYGLPTRKSLQVLERARQRFRSLPILMLVARRSRALTGWALRCQVSACLEMPCSPGTLDGSLRSLHTLETPPELPSAEAAALVREKARILPAVAYLRANYAEKIPLAKAAGLCDLDRFQFSRIFKKVNGITFQTYIIDLRIQRAAELMQARRASVTEAAFGAGFNDLSYFARMFRKQVGVSPSRYRAGAASRQISLFPEAVSQNTATKPAKNS